MKIIKKQKRTVFMIILLLLSCFSISFYSDEVKADSYDGTDLALAILANQSTLISSSYSDTDVTENRLSDIFTTLGTMVPSDGSTFVLISTGIAGAIPVTTDTANPGDERGTYFKNKHGHPRDEVTITMTLQVPAYMHYLYYDIQFFTSEYPEFIGTQYNDELTVTVTSPSKGTTTYKINVNSGHFQLNAFDIPGTGFDIFALSGIPGDVDWVTTTPGEGSDAGATALITREHPVSPYEEVIVTFNLKDIGDSMFDTAVFVDNLLFSGYAKTEITARKNAEDVNNEPTESGDMIKYTVQISNVGEADQGNNLGNEFEDYIPENTTYVPGSAVSNIGIINYNAGENKIEWNGEISSDSTAILSFNVTIDENLENGYIISNQGTVYWDTDEDGVNDATELTDDYYVDDGIDTDGDGLTYDDDPTELVVIVFEPPSSVTEDFSDDEIGEKATQVYMGRNWFSSSEGLIKGNFNIVSGYYYNSDNSFKTKIRSLDSPQYWNYSLSELNGDLEWWEVCLKCGNASDEYDLYLDFQNSDDENIARLKFDYDLEGNDFRLPWILKLYYWSPVSGWTRLNTDFTGGFLYNGLYWYKIRIEKNGTSQIDYSLYRIGEGLVDFKIDQQLTASFTDFSRIKFYSSENPIVCPNFFFDEHIIGLS